MAARMAMMIITTRTSIMLKPVFATPPVGFTPRTP